MQQRLHPELVKFLRPMQQHLRPKLVAPAMQERLPLELAQRREQLPAQVSRTPSREPQRQNS